MAIKIYEVDIQLFWNTQREETITVKASSERKAKIIAKEKAMKKFNTTPLNTNVLRARLIEEK